MTVWVITFSDVQYSVPVSQVTLSLRNFEINFSQLLLNSQCKCLCDLTICCKFTTIRTKWSYCCGNSLAGPLLTRNGTNGIMVHFHFIWFIWIRHAVHRNKYKTQKKNRKRDRQKKNSYTLKWLNYYIQGSRYQDTKPKVKVIYDSGTAGQPSQQ